MLKRRLGATGLRRVGGCGPASPGLDRRRTSARRAESLIGRHAPCAAGRCCSRPAAAPPANRITASALPRPVLNCTNDCEYISLASTCGAEVAAGHRADDVEDLQRGDHDRGEHHDQGVADHRDRDRGTASAGRARRPRRAASMMSSGIALIAAESTTMAKPVCTQTRITISRKLFSGWLSSQFGGLFQPSSMHDLAEQADLRLARVAVVVDELPDDAGADERDRHRHEDQRLVQRLPLAAGPPAAPAAGRARWSTSGATTIHSRVLSRTCWIGAVGERPPVVLARRRTSCGVVAVEAQVDRADAGITRPDQRAASSAGPRSTTMASGRSQPAGRPAGREEDDQQDGEEDHDGLDRPWPSLGSASPRVRRRGSGCVGAADHPASGNGGRRAPSSVVTSRTVTSCGQAASMS